MAIILYTLDNIWRKYEFIIYIRVYARDCICGILISNNIFSCQKLTKLHCVAKLLLKNSESCGIITIIYTVAELHYRRVKTWNISRLSTRLISRNLLRRAAAVSARLHASPLARLHAQLLTRSARDKLTLFKEVSGGTMLMLPRILYIGLSGFSGRSSQITSVNWLKRGIILWYISISWTDSTSFLM